MYHKNESFYTHNKEDFMQRSIKMLSLILSTCFINDVYSYSLLNTCRGEGNTLLRAQYNELDDFFKNQDYCVATLDDNTIPRECVAFGQDMDGNEIWAVSELFGNKVYIIPNGTFSEMKAAINNVITLKDIKGVWGIAYKDKDWYIFDYFQFYKFQIKQSNGKYSIDKWQSTSNLFPESNNQDETGRLKENLKNQNWRWDGSPGQLRSRQYPNNITFIKSDKGKTLSYKYNGQEQKQIYNGQNIWGFYYNQKGRVMICDVGEWDRDQKGYLGYKLVLITIPELYKK